MFAKRTIKVPTIASNKKPPVHKIPIAASHHKVAAVVSPLTLIPSLIITPAPKNPIPVTTWAAILVKSPSWT